MGTKQNSSVRLACLERKTPVSRHGLASLEGMTIGEVYNHHFKGDQMFGLYRELLKQRFPGVRIVPYTELPASYVGGDPATHRRVAQEVAAVAKEKGCDALITGNGG